MDSRLPQLVALFALVAATLLAAPAADGATYPTGFEERNLATGLTGPTAVAWTPDGRMLVAEKAGHLKVVPAGGGAATTILDISGRVNSYWDRGLLGLAVDSSFATNQYVYLLYTHDLNQLAADGSDPAISRLLRFRLSASNVLSEETVLLGGYSGGACPAPSNTVDCIPSEGPSHSIGTVRSAPDGTLWVGSGDASNFSFVDNLALRTYDEQSMAGKILHVDRNGRGLSGHPFCPANANLDHVCTKVWAKGFRNPFRFALRPGGTTLAVGDVGWETREEVDLISTGGKSFGWPCYEGMVRTPGYRDLPQCATEYAKEGTASANVGPAHDYAHNGASSAVLAGPTYEGSDYPTGYRGSLFFGDYAQGFIRRLVLDSQNQVTSVASFATGWSGTDLEAAPNGDLVYASFGDGSAGTGSIKQITYTAGNRAPAASASANPTSGNAPLAVQFSSAGSSDPDGDPLTYSWDFGDGSSSTQANPSHTYTSADAHTATLTVSDGRGRSATDTVEIDVGGQAPTVSIETPLDESSYRDGDTVALRGSATDQQDGPLPASRLSWHVIIHHASHIHEVSTFDGVSQASFQALRDHDADSYYEISLRATDSDGLISTKRIQIRPETAPLTIASDPSGAPVSYAGTATTAPFSTQAAIGFNTTVSAADRFAKDGRAYEFTGWSDGGQRSHAITVPATATTLTASYREDKAAGRPATASSFDGAGREPDKANDGSSTTRWSSAYTDNQWWQVDLGSVRQVDRVELNWETAYASRYRILTSTDGTNFSEAADVSILAPGTRVTTFQARAARYVRVQAVTRGTIYGISLWDAKVFGPADTPTPAEDKAAGQPTTASSSEGPGLGPANAVDGNSSTRWSSIYTDAQWWQVDLGRARSVDAVEINWEVAYASRYRIQTSLDGTTFTDAADVTIARAGLERTTFSTRSARYVRILGVTRTTPYGISFWDARVYGPPDGGADTTPPDTEITGGPTGTTAATSASFDFSSSEVGSTFQCRLDGGSFAACSSPKDYSGLADGTHTFEVRATDAAGNTDPTRASRTWTVQSSAPGADLALGKPATASSSEWLPTYAPGRANDGDFTTRWASSYADGQWWQVDLGSAQQVDAVELNWEAAYASNYKILTSLDGTTFSEAADVTISSAGLRRTTFAARSARYVRLLGVTRATPYGISFFDARVYGAGQPSDTTPPETTIDSGPSGTTSSTSASFDFSSSEAGSTFQCRLDGAAFSACTSPKDYAGLSAGQHTFEVRATDAADNTDASPASRTWTVEAPPQTTDLALGRPATASSSEFLPSLGPDRANDGSSATRWGSLFADGQWWQVDLGSARDVAAVELNWEAAYPSSYRILTSLDGSAFTAAANVTLGASGVERTTFSARSARYVRVEAIQRATVYGISLWDARVFGPSTASAADATPPDTQIDAGPSGTSASSSASFAFSATEPGSTFECRLDGGVFGSCESPKAYAALADGQHSFEVRATDAAGTADPTPATRSWTVDVPYGPTVAGTAGLVHWWRLGDSGTTAADSHGTNAGAYSGGPPPAGSLIRGDANQAHDFDGVNDFVDLAPGPFGTPARFTVEAWVRIDRTKTGGNQHFVVTDSNDDVASDGFALTIDSANKPRLFVAASSATRATATSSVPLALGTTYHVVGTYDGQRIRLYVNGVERASVAYSGGIAYSSARDLLIARQKKSSGQAGGFMDGVIDEVALYSVALDATTVRAHHGAGGG